MKNVLSICLIISVLIAGCSAPAATAAPTEPPPTAVPPTAVPPTVAPTLLPTEPPPTDPPTTGPAATEGGPSATVPPTTAPTETPVPPTDTPAAPPTPAIVYITYKDFEILPRQVTIKVGTTVVFLIEAGLLVSHQPYNFTGVNQFESPAGLGNGTSWSYTFTQPGTVTILCGYHAEMVGTVIVEP